MFNNLLIYIDEFSGFTSQEYEIIKKLIQIAKQVTITICTDDLMKKIKIQIYFILIKNCKKLLEVAKNVM